MHTLVDNSCNGTESTKTIKVENNSIRRTNLGDVCQKHIVLSIQKDKELTLMITGQSHMVIIKTKECLYFK